MSNKLPVDFAGTTEKRNISRNMAHKPRASRVPPIMIGFGVPLVCVLLLGAVMWTTGEQVQPGAVAEAAALGSPETPTPTPEVEVVQVTELVPVEVTRIVQVEELIEITQIVEVERVVVIPVTPTPFPSLTPQPSVTPNAYLTQQAKNQAQADHEKKVNRGYDWLKLAAWCVVGIVLMIGAVCFAIYYSVTKIMSAFQQKLIEASDETTAEDLMHGEYWHELYPDYRNRVWHLRKQDYIISDIVRDLWPQNKSAGGLHYVNVKNVLKEYDPMGKYGPTTPPPHSPTGQSASTQA